MKKKPLGLIMRNQWRYYAMLLPGLIFTFIFCYIPLYGVIIAFQDYNVSMGFHSPWAGMENFKYLFSQPTFVRTIYNTLFISVSKPALGLVVPVTFAVLLNEMRSNRLKRIYQTLIYIPNFLSWIIMAGVLIDILAPEGAINLLLKLMGLKAVNFLGDSSIFPWTMIVSDIWKGFGYGTIVYLAALAGVDPGLYESAYMDGATRGSRFAGLPFPF